MDVTHTRTARLDGQVGYSVGSLYGLGLFFENYFPTVDGVVVNDTATIGHGGMDWGSGASPVGYNKKWDFGIAFAVGAVSGINCSLPDALTNGNAWQVRVRKQLHPSPFHPPLRRTRSLTLPLRGAK